MEQPESAYSVPEDDQCIVRALRLCAEDVVVILTPKGYKHLVSIPKRITDRAAIVPGNFVLIQATEKGSRYPAEVVRVIDCENEMFYRANNCWPREYDIGGCVERRAEKIQRDEAEDLERRKKKRFKKLYPSTSSETDSAGKKIKKKDKKKKCKHSKNSDKYFLDSTPLFVHEEQCKKVITRPVQQTVQIDRGTNTTARFFIPQDIEADNEPDCPPANKCGLSNPISISPNNPPGNPNNGPVNPDYGQVNHDYSPKNPQYAAMNPPGPMNFNYAPMTSTCPPTEPYYLPISLNDSPTSTPNNPSTTCADKGCCNNSCCGKQTSTTGTNPHSSHIVVSRDLMPPLYGKCTPWMATKKQLKRMKYCERGYK